MEESIVIQLYQFIANYTAYRHLLWTPNNLPCMTRRDKWRFIPTGVGNTFWKQDLWKSPSGLPKPVIWHNWGCCRLLYLFSLSHMSERLLELSPFNVTIIKLKFG